MKTGIEKADPNKKITIIKDESEAIKYAIKNAKAGSLITMCSDVVPDALDLVIKLKEKESEKLYEFSKEDIPNQ